MQLFLRDCNTSTARAARRKNGIPTNHGRHWYSGCHKQTREASGRMAHKDNGSRRSQSPCPDPLHHFDHPSNAILRIGGKHRVGQLWNHDGPAPTRQIPGVLALPLLFVQKTMKQNERPVPDRPRIARVSPDVHVSRCRPGGLRNGACPGRTGQD